MRIANSPAVRRRRRDLASNGSTHVLKIGEVSGDQGRSPVLWFWFMAVVDVVEVVRMPVAASEKDEAIQARLGNPTPWSITHSLCSKLFRTRRD